MSMAKGSFEKLKLSVQHESATATTLHNEGRFVCRMITRIVWNDDYDDIEWVYMLAHVRPKLNDEESKSSNSNNDEFSEGGEIEVWPTFDQDDNGPKIPLLLFHLDLLTTMRIAKNDLKHYLRGSNTPEIFMKNLFDA